jgi:hypothetical protein
VIIPVFPFDIHQQEAEPEQNVTEKCAPIKDAIPVIIKS